jgi:hypothetical protein
MQQPHRCPDIAVALHTLEEYTNFQQNPAGKVDSLDLATQGKPADAAGEGKLCRMSNAQGVVWLYFSLRSAMIRSSVRRSSGMGGKGLYISASACAFAFTAISSSGLSR